MRQAKLKKDAIVKRRLFSGATFTNARSFAKIGRISLFHDSQADAGVRWFLHLTLHRFRRWLHNLEPMSGRVSLDTVKKTCYWQFWILSLDVKICLALPPRSSVLITALSSRKLTSCMGVIRYLMLSCCKNNTLAWFWRGCFSPCHTRRPVATQLSGQLTTSSLGGRKTRWTDDATAFAGR